MTDAPEPSTLYLRSLLPHTGIDRVVLSMENGENDMELLEERLRAYVKDPRTVNYFIEDADENLLGCVLCRRRGNVLEVQEFNVNPLYAHIVYDQAEALLGADNYLGEKTPGQFLAEHLFHEIRHHRCEYLDITAISDDPAAASLFHDYAKDTVFFDAQGKPANPSQADQKAPMILADDELWEKIAEARRTITEASAVEWNIIQKSSKGRDTTIHKLQDITHPEQLFFKTVGKMVKSYTAYHATRRVIDIDPQEQERGITLWKKFGYSDHVLLDMAWLDNIIEAGLTPGCLEDIYLRSDKMCVKENERSPSPRSR